MTDRRPLRVLHLAGSAQDESLAELSRLYARDCLSATADPRRFTPLIAHVSPDRRWRFAATLDDPVLAHTPSLPLTAAIAHLQALAIDVALPQMFCLRGMTEYRGLLDLLGIPYVGNRPETMAIGAHKGRARALAAAAGVAVPAGQVVRDAAACTIDLPVVVKPVDADNSAGVTFVRERDALPAAIAHALEHGSAALVEAYVPLGREVRCGVLDRGGRLEVLPLEEYAVDSEVKPIRQAADKLARDDGGALSLVAKDAAHAWIVDPDDPVSEAVGAAARACHAALGCRHYSLFDFRIDPAGRPWFLEAGLYCSFARQSVVCTMAAAAGIELPRLLDDGLAEALGAAASPTERSRA